MPQGCEFQEGKVRMKCNIANKTHQENSSN